LSLSIGHTFKMQQICAERYLSRYFVCSLSYSFTFYCRL